MKPARAIFLSLALLSIPSLCHAQLYAANISASLSTQVVTGTNYTIHTVPVTNATFINAILQSGSYPGLKAKDFAIVYTNRSTQQVEVINLSASNEVVEVIAVTGSNSSFNALQSGTDVKGKALIAVTDYEFTLPGVEGTVVTSAVLKDTYTEFGDALQSFSFSFVGASGEYTAGSVFLQGTITKGTKEYD